MKRAARCLAILGGFSVLLCAPAAQAQLASGYSGTSTAPRQGSEEHFWYSLRDLGDCFAKRKARESRALIASELGSPEESRATKALWGRYTMCLRAASRMSASTVLIRGAIAEGLYKKDFSAPPAAVKVAQPKAIGKGEEIQPYRLLGDFAQCFAASHPVEVHRLLTTTTLGEEGARAAVDALEPRFGECLPANVQIQFDPSEVRLTLAEALYKHAQAAGPAQRGN